MSSLNNAAEFPQMQGRLEDPRLLSGRGRYIDDLPILRNTLHAAIVRSTHSHAKIESIDTQIAKQAAGVEAVYTGADLAHVLDAFPGIVREAPPYYALANETVRYVGEPVAVVLARDRYAAEDGAELVEVNYQMLDAVVDVDRAAQSDAPRLHQSMSSNVVWKSDYVYGTPDAAFAKADRIVSVRVHFPKYNSTPLETYGVVAEYLPENDGYFIQANFQGPFSLMSVMGRALRVPDHRLRIVVPQDVGGSFGNKAMLYPYMALMAACAKLAKRPVKWIEDRVEHLLASASGTDRSSHVQAAITNNGKILALKTQFNENVGAYMRAPEPSCVMRSLTTFCGPYHIEHAAIEAACVLTNTLPTGLNRGYGGQQVMFTLERLVDAVAKEVGVDGFEIRRRNFLKSTDFPYRTSTGSYYDSGDYSHCLQKALDLAQKDGWYALRDRLRQEGRLCGIGVATAVHSAASNIGYVTLALPAEARAKPHYNPKSGSSDFAQITLDPSGRLRVQIGTAGAGQGHVTTTAQIVARVFELSVNEVDVIDKIDTEVTPWTITTGTYASRFAVVVGGAVQRAAARLLASLSTVAAHLLDVQTEQIVLAKGAFYVKGTANSLTLRQLAGALHWNRGDFPPELEIQLSISESYGAPNLASPDAHNQVNAAATYGFMADLALIEIDPHTCVPKLLKYIAVHDVGIVINPQLIRGQIAGGIVHGMGGALYEHLDYDENGQMLSASFMDYLCPTAVEAPTMLIDHDGPASPFTELGVKGCGENCAMSAPAAIASAVDDALFEHNITIDTLPITPPMLWRKLKEAA